MAILKSHIKLQTKCKIKYSEKNDFFSLNIKKRKPPRVWPTLGGRQKRNPLWGNSIKTHNVNIIIALFQEKRNPWGGINTQGSGVRIENGSITINAYHVSVVML